MAKQSKAPAQPAVAQPNSEKMGATQREVLAVLKIEPFVKGKSGLTVSEIAEDAGISHTRAGSALRGLAERGFLVFEKRGEGLRSPLFYTRIA